MKTIQRKAARRLAFALGVATLLWLPACDDDGTGPGDERAEQAFSFDMDASAITRLSVEGINGGISITGSATANSVLVEGVRVVRGPDARSHLADVRVEVQTVGDQVVARTTHPASVGNRQYTVDYEIVIPARLAVTVRHANGGILIEDIESAVSVTNANGGVVLDEIVGDVLVQVGNGGVEAKVTLPPDGTVEIGVGNGGIVLLMPTNTSAQLTASVGVGTIATSNLTLQNVVSTATTLSATLGAGQGAIGLTLGNGGITVTGF